jgi:hypothetical protein
MLTDAAKACVRQWIYTPTIVDGTAIPLRMTAAVIFDLRNAASQR